MGEDFPFALARSTRIDARDYALAAEFRCDVGHHLWPLYRRAVDCDLVCARKQQGTGIFDRGDAPTHGQRHKTHLCRALDHIKQGPAPFMRRGNIKEAQLVGTCRIIGLRLFDRIASIAQIDEIDALDHAPIGDIKAWNDTNADGHWETPINLVIARRQSRRGNPESARNTLDCRASLAMTKFC